MSGFKQAGQFVGGHKRDVFGASPINHDDLTIIYGAIA
jgi:hypothetical protein